MIDDTEIAVMVDIARSAGADLTGDKSTVVDGLIAKGLVAEKDSAVTAKARYRITPQGQALLDDRGVGANES